MSRGTVNAALRAWSTSLLKYIDLTVDGSGKLNTAGGGAGGGGAATIADGADVAEGATTDAAVVTDVAGTLSAKLRGLIKIFASVWDSGNGRLKVDGSGVTQPVSGTITATGPLTDTQLRATAVPVSGTVTASGPLTDTQLRASAVPISAAALPLPTGAALEAGHLATIDSHIPALGQALAAGSVPVVLTAAQAAALTPPAAIVGFALDSTVAKDSSLATITTALTTLDTDTKATQPRDVTDRAARLVGHVSVDTPTNVGDVVIPYSEDPYRVGAVNQDLTVTKAGRLRTDPETDAVEQLLRQLIVEIQAMRFEQQLAHGL